MAGFGNRFGKLADLANHASKMAAEAAANAGEAVTKAASDAGTLATQAAKATGDAAIMAKDAVTNFADEHPIKIEEVIEAASKVPGVSINRESYLLGALNIHTTESMAQAAVETSPAEAGVPEELINKLADEAISYENNLATATSVAAGLPSNPASMVGATVVDLGQFYAHVLRVAQKLGYLYGWKNIFQMEGDQMDDATRSIMVLFLGVMSGVQGAEKTLLAVAKTAGQVTSKRIARQALTKGTIYPIVKKVAYYLGLQMNKQIFGRAVGHAIPLLGGAISGVMTFATFSPMANRLKEYLAETPLAKPSYAAVMDVEDFEIELSEIEEELDEEIEELERS
ncbi:MAG: hypothetical protein Q4C09_00975 [Atopobiaceae bacterium]|nr:hypothetical protein [Atopobiaceae bacterium]